MNGDSRLLYVIGGHRNKIFWTLFVILGATLISGMIMNMFYIDILLGLFLIIIGLYKLGEEVFASRMSKEQQRVSEDMDNVMEWLSHSYEFTKRMKDRHESRLHHLDGKRAEMDKKIENNYREIVRKIIEVENRLNKTSRGLVRDKSLLDRVDRLARLLARERRMIEGKIFDISKRQLNALRMTRKDGRITRRGYVRKFRVRKKTAEREIRELRKKGFLRKRGRGGGTHYVLSF